MNGFLTLLLPWQETSNDQISDIFVYGILLASAVLLVIFLLKIIRQTHSIGSLAKEVGNLGSKYDRPADPGILNDLEKVFEDENKLFKKAWQEFKESLVIPERRKVVYKTDEASFFFSEDRLLGQALNLRFWNSVPALLVGLGILGTFVGLVWGLIPFSGIDFKQTEEIRRAIEELLSGVSTAFVTSVWGMLVSLLFNGVEKLCIGKVSREIAILQDVLDVPFTLKTEEEIAEKQKDELEQQTAALKSFSTDLANDIKGAMADGRQELIRELHSATKAFSSAITEQLEPTFNNLNTALEELQRQKEESSTDAIQQLVEEFQKSLSGSATAQMEALAETVSKASESLITLPEQLGRIMVGVQEQVNQTHGLLSKTSQNQAEQMKSMMEGMLSAFQEAIDTHQAGLSATTDSVNEEMEQIANKIRDLLKSTADRTDEQLAKRTTDMEKVSAQSIQMLQTTIEKLQESMTSAASQVKDDSEVMTNQMHQLVDQNASRLESVFETGQTSVSELLKQQADQIKEVNAQMDTSREILEKSREMLKQMEAGVTSAHELVATTQTLSDQLVTAANTLEDGGERLIEASDAFSEETAEYLNANRETIEQIQSMQLQSRQLLNDFSTRFETIDAGLKSIFEEIEEGLTNYSTTASDSINTYLNKFSDQLTQASTALAGSVLALDDSVEELTDMADRLTRQRGNR
ncbi:hypothetical protein C6503_04990 [Candidatus Poribacteria bacterium]|nr:MAG: hypothetical protein C6503_04990 [Candidatus Poribacteria bacterium]